MIYICNRTVLNSFTKVKVLLFILSKNVFLLKMETESNKSVFAVFELRELLGRRYELGKLFDTQRCLELCN